MLKVKNGVTPKNLQIACAAINAAIQINGDFDVIITSGTDGVHMKGSKHYTHEALDIRISNIPSTQLIPYVRALRGRLGKDFDVVLEDDHIHVEWDKKG